MGVSLLALVLAIGVMPSGASPAIAVSPDIVVSQIYGGGGNTGATLTHDFIELYNRGTATVDVTGWSVQYASATGSFWQRTALTGSIAPGTYYLVQEAAGTGGTAPLPTPQATGSIAMAAGAGKVALVREDVALTGTCPNVPAIADLVGYGTTASCYEGAGQAPQLSNTTAAFRAGNGATDTDNNSADFTAAAPQPRSAGGSTPTPTPTATPTPTPNVCGATATWIYDVQGTGTRSTMIGSKVTVEGLVVGDYQGAGQFGGFHVQEETAQTDGNPLTSDGIWVLSTTPVDVGDVVRVSGTVGEGGSFTTSGTQLTSVSSVQICPAGGSVTATDLALPVGAVSDLERYESMLVSFDQTLTVTETFTLGRFGEVVLSAGGRLFTPTAVVEPGPAAQAMQADNDRSRIVLDDANGLQNRDPILYPEPAGLSASNTLRVGDSVTGLIGVLDQRFALYRIQPVGPIAWDHTNPRPTAPAEVGGKLRVASMNVLNYFTTLDVGTTGCGPTGLLECRGAQTAEEFQRQRAKIISALVALDADIVGLNEIQNDDDTALADLVSGLNDALGGRTYDYVRTGTIGTDAIKVALIYKRADVNLVGQHAILDSTVDPRFDDTRSRPALAQTFKSDTDRLTVVVNHLKSKGSACAGDPDTGNGAGNCNVTRTNAAHALVDWLASDPTNSGDPDVLVIGDLNSYAKEDPIDVFVAAGYTDLIAQTAGAYSYVFQGQSGYLDYALASPSLLAQVTGAADWHINADEPVALDYNMEFKSDAQDASLYAPDAYRSSDHDPLVVGLRLNDQNEEKN